MLSRTRAIVLRTRDYSDQSLICSLYTKDFGRKNFMVKGEKSLPKLGFLQPGNILDIICHIGKGEMYTLSEFFLEHTNQGIKRNLKLSWLFLFTLEFLDRVFSTPDQDLDLYIFLECEIKRFSKDEKQLGQIHLEIMRGLMRYLGIKPLFPEKTRDKFFEVYSGIFVDIERLGTLNLEQSKIFLDFLKDEDKEISRRKVLDVETQQVLLSTLVNYYSSHLEGFRIPKSYELLCEMM